jgi:dTDP-4-amino-4,6-dideoxygalactose transaminase
MEMKIRKVPFHALGGIYNRDEIKVVHEIISAAAEPDGNFFPLPEEAQFQEMLAHHEGANKSVAVNSCGTALDCCMMALNVKKGDEVITTPLTFICTAGTAVARGAKVVFADIDPVTMNLDPVRVKERITPHTKAIIPVHFSGLACDIDAFDAITAETGIPVIYDAAHAIGTKYKGKPVGNRGKASCYSFQSNKNMTCLGEGGAITTDDDEFAEKVRQLKTFGYVYGPSLMVPSIGFNYRMTKIQYAVGIVQLLKIDHIIKLRQERMVKLNQWLEGVDELILPSGHGPGHGSHLHVLRLNTDKAGFTAADLTHRLKEKYKIGTSKHYPAVWTWEAFQRLGYNGDGCPVAAKACEQVFSTPVFPRTTEDDLEYIAWAIKNAITELRKSTSDS